jgi:hypothetical protein
MLLWDASPSRFRTILRPVFLDPLPNCPTNQSLERHHTITMANFSVDSSSSSRFNSRGHQKPQHERVPPLYAPPLSPAPSISSEVTRSACDPIVFLVGSPIPQSSEGACLTYKSLAGLPTSKYYTLTHLVNDIRHGIVDRLDETELDAKDEPRPGNGISGGFTSNQWAVASYGVHLGGEVWP